MHKITPENTFFIMFNAMERLCIMRTVFKLILWNKEKMKIVLYAHTIQVSVATTINHNKKNNQKFCLVKWTWLAQNIKIDDVKEEVKKSKQYKVSREPQHLSRFKFSLHFYIKNNIHLHTHMNINTNVIYRTISQPLCAANRFLFIDNKWA